MKERRSGRAFALKLRCSFLHAARGQPLIVCHQGDAVACQILLEQVDLIDGQRDDLAVHVGADQNHRTGQVVLAAHLQHLRRVVAEQQRGVGKVQTGIILVKAGQDARSFVQRDDGQLHIRGNGCEVDLAAPVCRQCSADTLHNFSPTWREVKSDLAP